MKRPWIDKVGHRQLTNPSQSLDCGCVQELDFFLIEPNETMDRIAQLNGHVVVLSLSFDSPCFAPHPSPTQPCSKI